VKNWIKQTRTDIGAASADLDLRRFQIDGKSLIRLTPGEIQRLSPKYGLSHLMPAIAKLKATAGKTSLLFFLSFLCEISTHH